MSTHETVKLRGITWNHSRGYLPMVATAQRFAEMHPHVEIAWEKRSLQEFADFPIHQLAERFDLLVLDHPWAGYAARTGVLLPLQDHLPTGFVADQAANSVGASHASYAFDGYQSALAIDAATPVASYRPDVLESAGEPVPQTWEQLIALARKGLVVMPGIPLDTLMNFYALCSTQGHDPFVDNEWAVPDWLGVQVLDQLRELFGLCPPEIVRMNPIAVYEALSARDDLAYCPFAYCYSNYSRPGYARKVLVFDDMVSIGGHGRCRTTLGGTGLAISAACRHRDVALAYAQFAAGPEVQRTLYFENGGQPGHRSAWVDPEVNRRSTNFFAHTLAAHDRAYLRPRYAGYLHFQDNGGPIVHDCVLNGADPAATLRRLHALYLESKTGETA